MTPFGASTLHYHCAEHNGMRTLSAVLSCQNGYFDPPSTLTEVYNVSHFFDRLSRKEERPAVSCISTVSGFKNGSSDKLSRFGSYVKSCPPPTRPPDPE